jgi:HEPN domain-containing protein
MDEIKKILVRRWLTKSKRDLASALKLSSGEERYLDTAIYHCHQAAEKAVKGFLVFHNHRLKKTHNIAALVHEAIEYDKAFVSLLDSAEKLTPYAEEYRYPDEELEPTTVEFQNAYSIASALFTFTLGLLPADVHP